MNALKKYYKLLSDENSHTVCRNARVIPFLIFFRIPFSSSFNCKRSIDGRQLIEAYWLLHFSRFSQQVRIFKFAIYSVGNWLRRSARGRAIVLETASTAWHMLFDISVYFVNSSSAVCTIKSNVYYLLAIFVFLFFLPMFCHFSFHN